MSAGRYYSVLFVIVVAGIVARAVHFNITDGFDDARYRVAAAEFAAPHAADLPGPYYARVGLRAILWAWSQACGDSLAATTTLMFCLSVTTVLLFASACRSLVGERAAVIGS